jgi:hypothetical protein
MSFDDAMLIEEMHGAAEGLGLTDQVAFLVEQVIGHDPTFFRNRVAAGGVSHALECELAILQGQGIIGENNEYPGPSGRVGQGD